VFELTSAGGVVCAVVLKAAKPEALISNMEREWSVGRHITGILSGLGDSQGLMRVGPALRTPKGVIIGASPLIPHMFHNSLHNFKLERSAFIRSPLGRTVA